ncbi:HAD hydrolase family protein [Limosilactobacillus fermentum]
MLSDQHNDLDMFDFSGTSVAVANGQDVVSKLITSSRQHCQDGVVRH